MALDGKQEQAGPTPQDCTKTETRERHDRCRRCSKGSRSTHHAGSMSRQVRHLSLPEYLTVDTLTLDYFKRSLKCFLFARY